jgi:hypothetical protein
MYDFAPDIYSQGLLVFQNLTYSGSIYEPSHPFSNAFDGRYDAAGEYQSGVATNNNGPYLYMTGTVAWPFLRVRFMPHGRANWATDFPKEVYVYYSDNNINWVLVGNWNLAAPTASLTWQSWLNIPVGAGSHKYWRMWIRNAQNAGNWCSFSECEINRSLIPTSALSTDIVTVPSGDYYGIELQSDALPLCKEIRIYTGDPSSYAYFTLATLSGGRTISADGSTNINIDYCIPPMADYIRYTDGTTGGLARITPAMTSDSTPSPCVVTGDFSFKNNGWRYPWLAFNQSPPAIPDISYSDGWAPGVLPGRCMISFGAGNAKKATYYRFYICDNSQNAMPKDWAIQGTNDSSAVYSDSLGSSKWTTLSTVSGASATQGFGWSDLYAMINPQPYIAYRMVITDAPWAPSLFIGEIYLYEGDLVVDPSVLTLAKANSEWGYVIGSSDAIYIPSTTNAWKAFGQYSGSMTDPGGWYTIQGWITTGLPSINNPKILAVYVGAGGKAINKYVLRSFGPSSSNNANFPKDWTLWGSVNNNPDINNDAGWVLLDSRTGIGDPGMGQWSSYFTFNNGNTFKWYRIKVTNSEVSNGRVGILDFKLVEASITVQTPSLVWTSMSGTWNSQGYYSYTFPEAAAIYTAQVTYVNNSNANQTVSGIQLLSDGNNSVSISGTISPLNFSFLSEPQVLAIHNTTGGSALPKIQVKYTGKYEVDRNIFISTTPDASSGWVGLDSGGYNFPERYPWELGTLSGTEVFRHALQLSNTMITGTWISPVFDWGSDLGQFYAYSRGNYIPKLEARTSLAEPAKAVFLITTTENTHENLMYKHKRVFIDSTGALIGRVECNSPQTGNKIWRVADYTFAGQPLNYYGSVNVRSKAAFLCPGITACGDMDPVQESNDPTKWYNLCTSTLSGSSLWNSGVTISGLEWGPKITALYTKTFPLEDSDAFFVASITTTTMTEASDKQKIRVNMALQDGDDTRVAMSVITLNDQRLLPSDTYDVIADRANNGWWVYLGGTVGNIYKVDVGSFNGIRVFGNTGAKGRPSILELADDQFLGYQYRLELDGEFKHIVEIPKTDYSGFWAFTASGITLFEEDYTYENPFVSNRREITYSTISYKYFTELHTGSCDTEGNMWIIDLAEERLMRVNLSRAMNQSDPNPVDYDNIIDGVIGVYPHPNNGSAYVFTSDEVSHPGQDSIRMVHAGQSPGSTGKYLCSVPGFCSAPYKYGVSFTGNVYDDYYLPTPSDPVWGPYVGNWLPVTNGGGLPAGRYKQFKITLSRANTNSGTPIIDRIRVPRSISLKPLDKNQTHQVAIKTQFERSRTFGVFNAKIIVWWNDEEYK